MDVKESEVTASTRKTHSVVLPRITEAVTGALEMMLHVEPNSLEDIERPVLDFVDALWNAPLRHSERRFFTGKIIDTIYILLGRHKVLAMWTVLGSNGLACPSICAVVVLRHAGNRAPPQANLGE